METSSIQSVREDAGRGARARLRTSRLLGTLIAAALPLIGLVSLLLRRRLDPHIENYRLHFVVFAIVGAVAFGLGYAAGEAANRRGDARVLLLSLGFMTTGGFLWLHAIGTPTILFSQEHAGFQVAIPVGLLVGAVFAAGSAFVDTRPDIGAVLMRRRTLLRLAVLSAMAVWLMATVTNVSPLGGPNSEAATNRLLTVLAILGTILYALSAGRYASVFRHSGDLLPAAVVACFVLLSEAMIGVAVTGERRWHASWWEWHGLIVAAYVVVGLAARREWREERFRRLYLATTRERHQDASVLFADLAGFTAFAEHRSPTEVAAVLDAYWGMAAPLITRRFGGEVDKFIGDGIMATFDDREGQPDHARRASCAALALQRSAARLAERHPHWPAMRVGVNSGAVVVREVGSDGHVAYPTVGDTVNTGARLESLAPSGGVLIGPETYARLPDGAVVEARKGLRMKGKQGVIDAYVLQALPCSFASPSARDSLGRRLRLAPELGA
jgi:adenylate cyclase